MLPDVVRCRKCWRPASKAYLSAFRQIGIRAMAMRSIVYGCRYCQIVLFAISGEVRKREPMGLRQIFGDPRSPEEIAEDRKRLVDRDRLRRFPPTVPFYPRELPWKSGEDPFRDIDQILRETNRKE